VCRKWSSALRFHLGLQENQSAVDLEFFFTRVAGVPSLASLRGQVLLQVSHFLEARFAAQIIAAKPVVADPCSGFSWKDACTVVDEAFDKTLALYTVGSVQMTLRYSCIGMATDKASVCGLPLQNTIFTVENNAACVGVPQVAADPPYWGQDLVIHVGNSRDFRQGPSDGETRVVGQKNGPIEQDFSHTHRSGSGRFTCLNVYVLGRDARGNRGPMLRLSPKTHLLCFFYD
jgi:hypothetical protein